MSMDWFAESARLESEVRALRAEVERLTGELHRETQLAYRESQEVERLRAALVTIKAASNSALIRNTVDAALDSSTPAPRMFTEEQVLELFENVRRRFRQACAFEADKRWVDAVDLKALLEAK